MGQASLTPATFNVQYEKTFAVSRKLHQEALAVFPNGVTHDIRHLEPFPVYVERASGAHKWTVEGRKLIDYFSGHGSLLLGHSHPTVVAAVQGQMAKATHPGACHALEIEWAKAVKRLVPSVEKLRFTSSGTEATMMALRLARIHTGKPRFLRFAGHFHGWHDFVLAGADLPQAPLPGLLSAVADEAVVVKPNDPEAVEHALATDHRIGCVILEPTGGHFGAVPIRGDFLRALREITKRHQRLLIFDEIITGFRVHPGGAQGHYDIRPDLTTLAKILAGGLPGGCVAGRADILEHLEFRPGKPKMRHQGTFNANPLSAAAGITALGIVADGKPCQQANDIGRSLRGKLNTLFEGRGVDWIAYGDFSGFKILTGYDGPRPNSDDFVPYGGDVDRLEAPRASRLAHPFRCCMLLNGVDLPGFAGWITACHTEADVDSTVAAVAASLDLLEAEGLLRG